MDQASWPPRLRHYVERAFACCRDPSLQEELHEKLRDVIRSAAASGELWTRDWDLVPLPLSDASATRQSESSIPASLPHGARTHNPPSGRTKYEGVPWEKRRQGRPDGHDNRNTYAQAASTIHTPGNNQVAYVPVEPPVPPRTLRSKPVVPHVPPPPPPGPPAPPPLWQETTDSTRRDGLVQTGLSKTTEHPGDAEEQARRWKRMGRFGDGQAIGAAPVGKANSRGKGKRDLSASNSSVGEPGGRKRCRIREKGSLGVELDSPLVGTCQSLEKSFFRLTSAPHPSTVRPEAVLWQALERLQGIHQNRTESYIYLCDQLKGMRQDCTVQRIRNQLTVRVYEMHARVAIENQDIAEFSQCQSQLMALYQEGIPGCVSEFVAYRLLYLAFQQAGGKSVLAVLGKMEKAIAGHPAIIHANKVREAVATSQYCTFFRLYWRAPNLGRQLMALYADKIRYKGLQIVASAYRPHIQVSYLAEVLGFRDPSKSTTDECHRANATCSDWISRHGGIILRDGSGADSSLDTKGSMSLLRVPELEGAVAHGDPSLALDDFLARERV
uniref:SAC3/GANP/THP3 conserved domain-containing protein n=1 Tax=Picocystis salinarum TaxID=88271 RepID=A0A7S3XCH4_9CHLO